MLQLKTPNSRGKSQTLSSVCGLFELAAAPHAVAISGCELRLTAESLEQKRKLLSIQRQSSHRDEPEPQPNDWGAECKERDKDFHWIQCDLSPLRRALRPEETCTSVSLWHTHTHTNWTAHSDTRLHAHQPNGKSFTFCAQSAAPTSKITPRFLFCGHNESLADS